MHFDSDDEDAFLARRDELGKQFATWLTTQKVPGDPNDAGLLMDWKWSYGDGQLDRWTVTDVHEFLFMWCPRKLSADPRDCADIPRSVAAFVEFLAHTGLLGRGADPPSRVRKFCETSTAKFVREMGDPANFGMAKSLFGGGIGPVPDGSGDDLAAIRRQLEQLPAVDLAEGLSDLDDDGPPAVIGPVRLPPADDRTVAIRIAPTMRKLLLLADFCAPPGRALTSSGALQLTDAGHLVEALGTGDDLVHGLRSADDLPELSRLVNIAMDARAIHHRRGRLLAVHRFAELDEVETYEKVVRAALGWPPGEEPDDDGHAVPILLELLDPETGADGVAVDALVESIHELEAESSFGLSRLIPSRIDEQVAADLDLLVDLGLVSRTGDVGKLDDHLTITAAGIPIAVELARAIGIEVVLQPDPATAGTAEIVDLIGLVDEPEWGRVAAAWLAAQPDPAAAGHALVGEVTAEARSPVMVLTGLEAIGPVLGAGAADAVRARLGSHHDGLVLHWLMGRAELDPSTVDPARYLSGLVDVLAAVLDAGDSADIVAFLGAGDSAGHLALLGEIWRIDHPRLPEVLETIGAQHPVKAVAKAARKALVRYRSRLASEKSR